MVFRQRLIRYSALFFLGIMILVGLDKQFPLRLPDQQQSYASVVLDRNGELLRTFADENGVWRYQVEPDEVSPKYLQALLTYEDRYFYYHPGVNPVSLLRAAWQWLSNGKVVSGGSTLTMQVARILHPHERSVMGKIQQIMRALQLEWYLSKDEILALYLNHAPFGGTVEGVQAASWQYLQKPAGRLRHAEAALLAVLPQAPSKLRPDRHPRRAQYYRDKVLQRLEEYNVWSQTEVQRAQQESVKVWPLPRALDAPLLSRRLRQEAASEAVIDTFVDRALQQQFQKLIKAYTQSIDSKVSAAALLVDNHSHQVLAYVGSADFLSRSRSGHVDMVRAVRSPGSTLKPFLYAMALDEGLIHSESLLSDVPRVSGQYRPGNFNQGFSGPVSATSALQRSLNLPFVQLIDALGAQQFSNRLAHVETPLKIPGGRANPSIILGGAGTSLENLVTMYSSLANEGRVYPLAYRSGEKESLGRSFISAEAAWITWNALRQIKLPDTFRGGYSQLSLPEIGWKTGTSWDYRDVWAIGVSGRYTLGVWLGRPDGQPMPKTQGRQLAGPLLGRLFQLLPHKNDDIAKPDAVESLRVCWPDGRRVELVAFGCDQVRWAYSIKGFTPRTLPSLPLKSLVSFYSPYYPLRVDSYSGLRLSPGCSEGTPKWLKLSLWPQALEPWLPNVSRRIAKLPEYHPGCTAIEQRGNMLRILGVKQGQIFHNIKQGRIRVAISAEGASGQLNWYLNGRLLEDKVPDIELKLQSKEEYELIVQDRSGATGRVTFKVI